MEFTADLSQRQYLDLFEMKNVVSGNKVEDADFLLSLVPGDPSSRAVEPVASGYARIENIDFTGNRIAGSAGSPRIKFPPGEQGRIRNVKVTGNVFSGAEREMFWENSKTPAPAPEQVFLKDNRTE